MTITATIRRVAAARRPAWLASVLVCAVCSLPPGISFGQPVSPSASARPKIGLVLGGGGAKGAAHVGVLKVLEELRVPIDFVVGTSMGAIIGGLYASGMRPEQIGRELGAMDWPKVFDDATPRPDRPLQRKRDDEDYLVKKKPGFKDGKIKLPLGVVQGQNFALALTRLTLPVQGISDFDELPIPFRAVSTDIETGESVVLEKGHLARALQASMAVPGAFAPVEIDGRLLVDGGISDNLPIGVARDMGADVVIVVDLADDLKTSEELTSVLKMIGQLAALLTVRNAKRQLATLRPSDVHLQPDLRDVGSGSFDKVAEAIAYGEESARAATSKLLQYAASPRVYEAYLAERNRVKPEALPVIDFIRLDNESPLSDELLTARLRIELGTPLDVAAVEAGIANLYGLDVFESVRYEVVEDGTKTGLHITAVEKSWGPDFLQFGIALAQDFNGDTEWNIGARYLKTNINSLGGEMRFSAQVGARPLAVVELYQPLDVGWRYFIRPRLFFQSRDVGRFANGEQLDEFRVRRVGASVQAGRLFGNNAELAVGFRRYIGEAEMRIGSPRVPDSGFNNAELFVRFDYDTLDNRNFPTDGALIRAQWNDSIESLGGDDNFSQFNVRAGIARSWGRNTFTGSFEFAETLHGTSPLQNRFQVGGFTNLSGFAQDEISGQQVAMVRAIYYRALKSEQLLAIFPSVYVGGTVEYGNAFEKRGDISFDPRDSLLAGSIFLGVDTILAPLYFAYGHAERGNDSVYIFLGRVF